jgi:hypothetical protein
MRGRLCGSSRLPCASGPLSPGVLPRDGLGTPERGGRADKRCSTIGSRWTMHGDAARACDAIWARSSSGPCATNGAQGRDWLFNSGGWRRGGTAYAWRRVTACPSNIAAVAGHGRRGARLTWRGTAPEPPRPRGGKRWPALQGDDIPGWRWDSGRRTAVSSSLRPFMAAMNTTVAQAP